MKLTLEQVKENFLNDFIIDRTECYTNLDGSIDPKEQKALVRDIKRMKKDLSKIKNIKGMVRMFDDERFESWDVHGMLEFALNTCCYK